MTSSVLFDLTEGVATVTLNRPENANAVDGSMRSELRDVWADVRRNDNVHGVVVTGAGERHFCTGRDMKWQVQRDLDSDGEAEPFADFYDIWKPIIVAVNGVCAGGGFHFIWQSDFAIAAESATFLEPHVSVSHVPNREMLGLAARMVPLSVLLRMAMMGKAERLNTQQALTYGIITEVVADDNLLGRAHELMGVILSQSAEAVQTTKKILHSAFGLEYAHKDTLLLTSSLSRHVNRGQNAKEGARAFTEKRVAQWPNE